MAQEFQQITETQQNRLAKLYPFWFDRVPDQVPAPLLFGSSNYTIEKQIEYEDLLMMKDQQVQQVHENGTEYEDRTILSSHYVQSRHRRIQARKNYQERLEAGAVPDRPALGIVGNNLDKCNTSINKKTRAGLFRAQNMIQKIRLDGEKIVSDNVSQCGKPLGRHVQLQRNREHGSGSINGVQTCQSVWACPVCRSRIVSKRAEELKEIYQAWSEKGGRMYMVTLTVPHSKEDNLAELYGSGAQGTGLSAALGKFRASRDFSKDFKNRVGYYGDIRGIEVTWGRENGFHPHIHMLVLTRKDWNLKEWKYRFFKAWRNACLGAGLQAPSFERGVVISKCQKADQAQYLAKWSAATEIQSDGMKQAKHGNFSISELERCLWDKEFRKARKLGMTRAAAVLKAYYGAMKGQRQLQTGGISPDRNWKKELLEITDEDETETENHDHICYLKYKAYIKIKRSGKFPDLLEAAERGNTARESKQKVREWLQENNYPPDTSENPNGSPPPPLVFSYLTGFEEKIFQKQKEKSDAKTTKQR